MTRKSVTRMQRARTAGRRAPSARAHSGRFPSPFSVPEKVLAEAFRSQFPHWADTFDCNTPSSQCTLSSKRVVPSARRAIVAAAFGAATNGAVRRQIKGKSALAVVVIVPGPSWVRPVCDWFVERFGDRWQTITSESVKMPHQKSEQNSEVASYLAHGSPVVGFAVERDALPASLTAAADLTIRIRSPGGATIGRAIRMFTGCRVPACIDENIAKRLEFYDLVAAFRTGSSPAEIVARIRKATTVVSEVALIERLPNLEDAVEYGAARVWGLALARDIADYRAGNLDWEDVDRGAVLHSEPGLGKSLYARILAKACGIPLVALRSPIYSRARQATWIR
ncbi:hypothetical protein [Bradyrhizobium sp. NAS80.1]|uniref:hypothetical protein n=1 Tax=Bradyrhizobium sp. NAS80.1 TaxID=1680159 RepID=UPI001FDAAA45|nr:hypothetical protein [Bradyrhizobium sp. NAS80.1]